ncbi:hypothetical protein H3H54_09960 [Brachybacterium sp. Z12]|uniref:hypothetical protein n=1 Tax=Brachybacterium sp. Z12 TaxID=2759167 RepID=UPI00186197DB|nr:hypothetical protein [Brachybacterium sp. Z12]QNN81756.1 hypothetical protein H3H54_09960 [Brachybacterium sp. Z12]
MSSQPETPVSPRKVRRAAGDRAMQRATLLALVVGAALAAVVVVIAASRPEPAAFWGALVGSALTLVMVLPTVGITFLGKRLTPVSMAATVLGSWAVKMFIVILVLIAVRDLESISMPWIGLALLVGAVSAVLVEAVLLARARQPLDVEPHQSAEEEQGTASGA